MLPFVSILTPTRNRRLFLPQLLRGFQQQDYPGERMELIVLDDGEDAVGDLFDGRPGVRYVRSDTPGMPIGAKRNALAGLARGDVLVHMDDDDYYPPTRVSHAVAGLRGGDGDVAGASMMHICFLDALAIVRSGPFGAGHATANTLAYRRRYLETHRFDDAARCGEEPSFTEGFRVPMVQLDSRATILCIAHGANTYDKSQLTAAPTVLKLKHFTRCERTQRFYRHELPRALGLRGAGSMAGAG